MEASTKITKSLRKEDAVHDWFIVDASDMVLGRLATQVAVLLRGKHKANFTPHVDNGDYVIVLNASKLKVLGKREGMKEYFHYTGYPGGGRMESFKSMMSRKPALVVEHAVKGMLPKTKLGRQIIKKLKVYPGAEHVHAAQMPKEYKISN